MKQLYLLLLFCIFSQSNSQIIDFPDQALKAKLLSSGVARNAANQIIQLDVNSDDEISVTEASAAYSLSLSSANIVSLEGLGSFANLRNLTSTFNNITAVDLNLPLLERLDVHKNEITTIDFSGMPSLKWVICYENNLSVVNFTGLSQLQEIDCHDNFISSITLPSINQITKLDCSVNEISAIDLQFLNNINNLNVGDNNLTELVFPAISSLEHVGCYNNEIITLDLSPISNLIDIGCANNLITSINVSGLTHLTWLSANDNQMSAIDISSLTSLLYVELSSNNFSTFELNSATIQSLNLSNNSLSSFTVVSAPAIYDLRIFGNDLTSINFHGLESLSVLHCGGNQFSSIDVTSLTQLSMLTCDDNQLTSLNVTGLGSLATISCTNNLLTYINLAGVSNLSDFVCFGNQITSLDLDPVNATSLLYLQADNNQLTTLDLNRFSNMSYITVHNNPLISLFIKNGGLESIIDGFPATLEYICADTGMETEFITTNLATQGLTTTVNSYCSFTPGGEFFSLNGQLKYDFPNDGCTGSDPAIGNALLHMESTDAANSGYFSANNYGSYDMPIQAGEYILQPMIENIGYFNISPQEYNFTLPALFNPLIQNFCVTPNGTHTDVEIVIIPVTQVIPGFSAKFNIVVKNIGNMPESGQITFGYQNQPMSFATSSPLPAAQSNGILQWNYLNLQPFQKLEFLVTMQLNTPTGAPPLNNGDEIILNGAVTALGVDENITNNSFILHQDVLNSFDPNDKTCLEGTTITPEMVGEYVHYLIRFENTGTANAQNIVVKDMIDIAKFDISSLIPLHASHPFITRITETNKVEFIFENINLPFDDANNDGYVAFKIKTKPTLVLGDSFSNTASIYFDYNFPIVTDPATTTIAILKAKDFEFSDYFGVYPNPVNDVLNIQSKENIEINSISIYNTLGQLLLVIPKAENISKFDVSSLRAGNYFIKIYSQKGSTVSKFIKE